jgi:hypothetical protein
MPDLESQRGLRTGRRSNRRVTTSAEQLIHQSRLLSEEINRDYSSWALNRRRGRAACQLKAKLTRIIGNYRRLDSIMTNSFSDERGVATFGDIVLEESPLTGTVLDVLPFANFDQWSIWLSEVSRYCSHSPRGEDPRPPTPPIPTPTPPIPSPSSPNNVDELIRRVVNGFIREWISTLSRGSIVESFTSNENIAGYSRLSLYFRNFYALLSGESIFVCQEAGTEVNKNIARRAKRDYQTIRLSLPENMDMISAMNSVLNRYGNAWWEQAWSHGGPVRRPITYEQWLRGIKAGSRGRYCSQFVVREYDFNNPSAFPGHELLQ